MHTKKQMSETVTLGVILAIVGGFLDAYTYICRGGVFANAQTGNIVLLGVNLAKGNVGGLKYFVPILAFAAGVLIAEIIKNKYKFSSKVHWRQIIIVVEIAILAIVCFIPIGHNTIANILVSFVCSLQVQSFRKMGSDAYATTMCTGNLRSATEHLFYGIKLKQKDDVVSGLKYILIIFAFIVGAIFGTLLTNLLGIKSLFCACIGLLLVFILMESPHKLKNQQQ